MILKTQIEELERRDLENQRKL
eukprot:SAG11_NODE_32898_length_280_cov_0.574586_1_plen_21_part_10